ncbi:protein-methionine-sulfoxide reductase catalytic subunit MsrP [Iodidimonas gelatinilytica]|uniref:Protein-methionine-sulfoxide reductase catalytic subunit MsrP n=1 Tax=Iodidimonas gelatinilytica TaxID=1236966 RepID=A0A5A7N274_9PROT|nr:protein-methionine-sulfoxide reductase catalytic subunit MsrP [Iodidimonas gelatinilytica]GEQ97791.1 protein-methionine-sulfoxide reductase catalytic subunit MsrP [Iodidimonas gelatinilytica]GER01259.1 protein-methionine-sulfoxide reductase catalytic subunit MsrP [Iodidimonas gelatinilytica]
MLINIRKSWHIPESGVTPKALYYSRRHIMKTMAAAGIVGIGAARSSITPAKAQIAVATPYAQAPLNKALSTEESLTDYKALTSYNNFYEFGTDKSDPKRYASAMKTEPWSVKVSGAVEKAGTYSFDDLITPSDLESRIYRLRCVEGWSMVVPWIGIPLHKIIRRLQPTSKARYVQFETLADRKMMRGLRFPVLDWPYKEGLRMDEALHPLTLLATGLYDAPLPNQNGAPLRLVIPWKYGFKSIKSIVAIRFTEKQPITSWNQSAPSEYGFYANVNPKVRHPRWSQATERRIGDFRRRDSLMFNGYAEEVAGLYSGMDLRTYF